MNRFLLTCVCLASALLAASAAVAENITIADSATFNANVTITGVNTFAGLGVPDGGYVIVNTLAGLPNNTRDAATNTSVTADGIALNLTPDDSLGDVYSCGYLVRGDAGWGDLAIGSATTVFWPSTEVSTAIIPPSGTTALAVNLYAGGNADGGAGLSAYAEVFFSDATSEDVTIPWGSSECQGFSWESRPQPRE